MSNTEKELSEGTEQVIDTPAPETEQSSETVEQPQESAATDSTEANTPVDIGDVWSTEGDPEILQQRLKEAHRLYTQKAQAAAERKRILDEWQAYFTQQKTVQEKPVVPQEPEVPAPTIPALNIEDIRDPKHFEEVYNRNMQQMFDTLNNAFEQRLQNEVKKAIDTTTQAFQPIAQSVRQTEWTNAYNAVKQKYGDSFIKAEPKLAIAFQQNPTLLNIGTSPEDVLERAFRTECPEEYAEYIISKRATAAEKAKEMSSQPAKTPKTPTIPTGNTREAVLQRIEQKLASGRVSFKNLAKIE